MRFELIAALLFSLALAVNTSSPSSESLHSSLHPAPIIYNNPQDALYEATLFDKSSTTVRGWLTAWAPPSGVGVKIHADFWGLPDSGPYRMPLHQEKCGKAMANLVQHTTSTSTSSPAEEIANWLADISTPITAARNRPATPISRRHARSVI